MTSDKGRQPWLHDRQVAVYGNATVLSAPDATIGDLGTGLIVDDRLVLGRLRMTLDGEAPRVIAQTSSGALTSVWACARNIGDTGPDPTVEVHIRREVVAGGLQETI